MLAHTLWVLGEILTVSYLFDLVHDFWRTRLSKCRLSLCVRDGKFDTVVVIKP